MHGNTHKQNQKCRPHLQQGHVSVTFKHAWGTILDSIPFTGVGVTAEL